MAGLVLLGLAQPLVFEAVDASKGVSHMVVNDLRIKEYFQYYKECGFSVIPVNKENKALVDWKEFQSRKPNDEEIES